MKDLTGRVAVVTGGGSGIGEALVAACAAAEMKVVVADVEEDAAARVAARVRERGGEALAARVDVRDAAAVEALAARTVHAFGACHVLFNNAGVVLFRPAVEMKLGDWRWILEVNLLGVAHGIAAFLPRIRATGEGGHIVNTASIAGLISMGAVGLAAYTASKFGVVGMSEVLRQELAGEGIGVSVLCPGGVATRITESERNRPHEYRTGGSAMAGVPTEALEAREGVLQPDEVARRVLEAVRDDVLYVITHPEWRDQVEARNASVLAAFAGADRA